MDLLIVDLENRIWGSKYVLITLPICCNLLTNLELLYEENNIYLVQSKYRIGKSVFYWE